MKQLTEHLKDYRSILEAATIPPRNYERKGEKKNEKPKRARFKLKIWFKDGNEKTFYSYDLIKKPDGSYQLDEWNGLFKLLRLINQFRPNIQTAVIYANLDLEPKTANSNYNYLCYKLTYTKEQTNPHVSFDPKTNQLNLERIYKRLAELKKLNK